MAQWKNICGSNLAHGRLHRRGYCIRHTRLRPRRPLLVCSGQPVPPWAHWHPTIGWKMRRSWDAGRKWGARLWKVEIRVVAHHGLMTGSLPEARLSPPAQPKQKQIIVFKCDRSSVNVLSYAKEIPIVDKMVSQFYLPVARIIIILFLLTLSRAPPPSIFSAHLAQQSICGGWEKMTSPANQVFPWGVGVEEGLVCRDGERLNHRKPCNINSEWLYV